MKTIRLMTVIALISFMKTNARAQNDADVYNEAYARAHIAYTDFMKLGITSTTYAKCITVSNFYEQGKIFCIASFNGEEFRDDGKGNDKMSGDGILTSIKTTPYEKGSTVAGVGSYFSSPGKYLLCDPGFIHTSSVPEMFLRIKVDCDIEWVNCNTWPANLQSLCLELSWPFSGYFTNRGCKWGISIF